MLCSNCTTNQDVFVWALHRLTQITPCTSAGFDERHLSKKVHFLFLGKTSMWVDAVKAEDGCIETVNKGFFCVRSPYLVVMFLKTEMCQYSEIDACFPPGFVHFAWMAWMIFAITASTGSIITPPPSLITAVAAEIISFSWLSGGHSHCHWVELRLIADWKARWEIIMITFILFTKHKFHPFIADVQHVRTAGQSCK